MVTIREIEDIPVELYSPNDELIGIIKNMLQFNDVRLQIKLQNLDGYYVKAICDNLEKDDADNLGGKICINSNGKTDRYPNGFFDISYRQFHNLLQPIENVNYSIDGEFTRFKTKKV